MENKINLFIFYPEMQPILFKDSANRMENKIILFIFYPEMQPISFKDSAKIRLSQRYENLLSYPSVRILSKNPIEREKVLSFHIKIVFLQSKEAS